MSVEVSPRDYLGFQRPFINPVTSDLKLHNPHHKPIVVKIKVTSPKAYTVRPNSSRIEPGETLEVSVILQPMKEQPPPGAKCKDKFLICSAVIPVEKENLALTEFWYELEKTNKSAIKEHKLRVAYLSSENETIQEDAAGEVSRYHDAGFGSPAPFKETSSVSTPVSAKQQSFQPQPSPSPSPFIAQNGLGNGNGSSIAPGLPYPAVPIHVTNVQTQNTPSPMPIGGGTEQSYGSRQSPAIGTGNAAGYELGAESSKAKEQGAAVPSPAVISTSTSSAAITAPAPTSNSNPTTASAPSAPTLQRQNTVPKPEINSLAQTVVHTVEDQLDHAKQEIQALQRQLAQSGFGKQVKMAVNDVNGKAEQMGIPTVEGYTVGWLLAVAVAAFAVGYLYNRSA